MQGADTTRGHQQPQNKGETALNIQGRLWSQLTAIRAQIKRGQGHKPLDQPHPPRCSYQKEDKLGGCMLQNKDHIQNAGQHEMAKKYDIGEETR